MKPIYWAALLAPIIGPAMWWVLQGPGRVAYRYLWKKLPDGRLRRVLLRKI